MNSCPLHPSVSNSRVHIYLNSYLLSFLFRLTVLISLSCVKLTPSRIVCIFYAPDSLHLTRCQYICCDFRASFFGIYTPRRTSGLPKSVSRFKYLTIQTYQYQKSPSACAAHAYRPQIHPVTQRDDYPRMAYGKIQRTNVDGIAGPSVSLPCWGRMSPLFWLNAPMKEL